MGELVRFVLASEKSGEEAAGLWFLWCVGIARALLCAWHVCHDLLNVLAATGPGGLLAFTAFDCAAHKVTPRMWVGRLPCFGYRPSSYSSITHTPWGIKIIEFNFSALGTEQGQGTNPRRLPLPPLLGRKLDVPPQSIRDANLLTDFRGQLPLPRPTHLRCVVLYGEEATPPHRVGFHHNRFPLNFPRSSGVPQEVQGNTH